MSRASKRSADMGFAAITIEGGLIAPDQIVAIASATPDQKLSAEYGCPKGTNLRDEITRYFRIAQAHWQAYARVEQPTMKQTSDFARSLLEQAFGFALNGPHHHSRDDRRYLIAWEAKGGRVPVVVAPPPPAEKGRAGDGFARALPEFGDGEGGRIQRRSPTVLLQDWLNANPDFYWGLVFAGDRVRLMRDNASFTRPAWIEADLGAIFKNDMFADFAALWLLIHNSRFGAEGAPASDCALERWREAGQRAGTAAREKLRGNVEDALLALGQALLDGNPALRDRLDRNELTLPQLFEQMLRVVYRLIFLGVAEDRDLLHSPGTPRAVRELYANNYGFAWLRDRSSRRSARDHHHDAWETVKIVFRALERGEKQLGLPALGGLFDRSLTPDLDAAQIPNRQLLEAAFRLAWLVEDGRRVRINWRDMATEELGSVYEGLLELVPARGDGGRTFTFVGGAEARGNARKVSGSYYTPDSLVQCLLDSALNPVLDQAEAEGGVDAILDLKIIDPACGSGHFLLGAARRMATRVAQLRNPDAPDYNAAMRDVVRGCVHGVDRNPMAVELAKVALWIESVEPGKPLGFLDANIQCGDSLLGIFNLKALDEGIPDDAYKPLTGDDKETAKYFAKRNKDEKKGQGTLDFASGGGSLPPARLAAAMDELRLLPEDTVAQVAEKRRLFAQWQADPRRYATKVACDLYVAAFVLPKTGGVPLNANSVMVPTTAHLRARLGGGNIYGPLEGAAIDAAEFARAFHWPLAFPQVMIGRGGFDVVLGNPPWEVVQLGEEEYFASRVPEIASLKGSARKRAIAALEADDAEIFGQYQSDKRKFDAVNEFARAGGRFDLTARGKVNTYGLFAEHFLNLSNDRGGAGVILPTGIATDASTAPFFAHIVEHRRLASLYSFENEEFIFPGVHHSFRFCLLALSEKVSQSDFAFFLRQVGGLQDERRRFQLTPMQIAAINPNSKTAPVFRTRRDAELAAQIYIRVPVFVEEGIIGRSNLWSVEFRQGMFNMTTDSHLFRTAAQMSAEGYVKRGPDWVNEADLQPEQAALAPSYGRNSFHLDVEAKLASITADRYVPLYEAKMIHLFDHRWATYDVYGEECRDTTENEKLMLTEEPMPRYWVPKREVDARLASKSWYRGWLMGWRDVTSAHVLRTLISSAFPLAGVGNNLPLMFFDKSVSVEVLSALLGNLCSLTCDFVTRFKVGGNHLNFFIYQQLPILPPTAYDEAALAFIVPKVLELTYTSQSMAPFARDLGHEGPPFAWDEARRAQLRAELDAWYALAYGLSRDELRYVLDPKDVMGADYPSETFRVLQNNEMRTHGEYRTRRLVLAAYDALVVGGMRPRTEGWK